MGALPVLDLRAVAALALLLIDHFGGARATGCGCVLAGSTAALLIGA
jgi:hypothetical protein